MSQLIESLRLSWLMAWKVTLMTITFPLARDPLLRNHVLVQLCETSLCLGRGSGPSPLGVKGVPSRGKFQLVRGGKGPICLIPPSLGQSNCPFNLCGA